jgi:hypothetical protein
MLCLSDAFKPVILFESCAENGADAAIRLLGAGRRLIWTAVLEAWIVVVPVRWKDMLVERFRRYKHLTMPARSGAMMRAYISRRPFGVTDVGSTLLNERVVGP